MEKLKIKNLFEIAKKIFKNARETTVLEQIDIDNFIKSKFKVILSKLSKKI